MLEDYEVVYRANGQLDGEMIRIFLESKGIQALAYGESVGATYGLTVAPLGEVRIMVPASQAEEARQILEDMEAGKYEQPRADEFFPPADDMDEYLQADS
jgi:hypothetical protein